jgi:glycine/D-amino acid oxidase-like deaminating enzyme
MTGPAGALWPYRFVGGVLSVLSNKQKYPNFLIEAHTPVESIAISKASVEYPYELRTPRGIITAQRVIHCTNAHSGHLLPSLREKIFPVRGQMTLQSTPPSFPRVGNKHSWVLHYSPGFESFDYITQSPLPSGEIYLGGGLLKGLSGNVRVDDLDIGNVRDDQQSEGALKALEGAIEARLRDGKGITLLNKWTGIMGFTIDDLPIVGRVPYSISGRSLRTERSNEWVAAGFCGSGMEYCWLTGKAVAEMVLTGNEDIGDWFPWNEFACSQERFGRTDLGHGISSILHTVP